MAFESYAFTYIIEGVRGTQFYFIRARSNKEAHTKITIFLVRDCRRMLLAGTVRVGTRRVPDPPGVKAITPIDYNYTIVGTGGIPMPKELQSP